jgi:dolichol-phosphate mannosyltransferase
MIKVIFCAYNEEKSIKDFVTSLNLQLENLKKDFELITCIDGSSDKTLEILQDLTKSYNLKILPIKNQRGLGSAYKRLFNHIIKSSKTEDIVISLDADITHNPQQIPKMLKYFTQNKLDLLVASRFCEKSTMSKFPLYRILISKSISIFLQTLFRVKKISNQNLQDFTSGYRIYSVQKLSDLWQKYGDNFIKEKEFTYTCELLIKLSRVNAKIDETPIEYDYGKKIGESKLRIGRNMYRLIILVLTLFLTKK